MRSAKIRLFYITPSGTGRESKSNVRRWCTVISLFRERKLHSRSHFCVCTLPSSAAGAVKDEFGHGSRRYSETDIYKCVKAWLNMQAVLLHLHRPASIAHPHCIIALIEASELNQSLMIWNHLSQSRKLGFILFSIFLHSVHLFWFLANLLAKAS